MAYMKSDIETSYLGLAVGGPGQLLKCRFALGDVVFGTKVNPKLLAEDGSIELLY